MKQYVITGLLLVMSVSLSAQTDLHRAIASGDVEKASAALDEKVQEFSCNGERIFESMCGENSKQYNKFITSLGKISKKLAPVLNPHDELKVSFVVREKLSSRSGIQSLKSDIQSSGLEGDTVDFVLESLNSIDKFMADDKKVNKFKKNVQQDALRTHAFQVIQKEEALSHIFSQFISDDEIYHEPLVVEYVNTPDENGRTPLHLAAKLGFAEIVSKLIFYGAKRDVQDDHGETPLHAFMKNMPEFLEEGRSQDQIADELTPSMKTLDYLICVHSEQPDNDLAIIQDHRGKTFEHYAASHKHGAPVRYVLNARGLKAQQIKDKAGKTPSDIATDKARTIISTLPTSERETLENIGHYLQESEAKQNPSSSSTTKFECVHQ